MYQLIIVVALFHISLGFSFDNHVFSSTRISKLGMTSDDKVEKAWRFIKKPLLRVGGKGLADSHGNSLRELLLAHTCVKVKVNTDKLGTMEEAFESLREVTEKNGVIKCELIQCRNIEKTILIGKEGALEMIMRGEYPPSLPSDDGLL